MHNLLGLIEKMIARAQNTTTDNQLCFLINLNVTKTFTVKYEISLFFKGIEIITIKRYT